MKNALLSGSVVVGSLLLRAAAVDMTLYEPSTDVDSGFATFLEELYAETEDPASTTTFTDFFTTDGTLTVMQETAVGADEITALKQTLMPTDGSKIWNHMPNVTTVSADEDTSRTYEVLGVIQTTFEGGNCSRAYYSTQFTVAKNTDSSVNLALRAGSLIWYNDYLVYPSTTPTDIPCE